MVNSFETIGSKVYPFFPFLTKQEEPALFETSAIHPAKSASLVTAPKGS